MTKELQALIQSLCENSAFRIERGLTKNINVRLTWTFDVYARFPSISAA